MDNNENNNEHMLLPELAPHDRLQYNLTVAVTAQHIVTAKQYVLHEKTVSVIGVGSRNLAKLRKYWNSNFS